LLVAAMVCQRPLQVAQFCRFQRHNVIHARHARRLSVFQLGRKVLLQQGIAVGHQHRALEDVAQFPVFPG
jgi:hypothetical protein